MPSAIRFPGPRSSRNRQKPPGVGPNRARIATAYANFKIGMKFCLLLLAPVLASAQNLKEFEKKVTEFTLANGMHFIVLERHEAPVVSFNTYVKAGSLDDPAGQTGLAHMFEHMAFKGTPWIGSKNWPEEKKAL